MDLLSRNGTKLYPLGDSHKDARYGYMRAVDYMPNQSVKAIHAWEYRHVKKGEWFLSGAQVTAYKAPNDLNWNHHIAKIVKVEKRIEYIITGILGN